MCSYFTQVYLYGRVYAAKLGLRRPWDGEDGKNYKIFQRRFHPNESKRTEEILCPFKDKNELEKYLQEYIDSTEFNWIDMEDMTKFDRFDGFKQAREAFL